MGAQITKCLCSECVRSERDALVEMAERIAAFEKETALRRAEGIATKRALESVRKMRDKTNKRRTRELL